MSATEGSLVTHARSALSRGRPRRTLHSERVTKDPSLRLRMTSLNERRKSLAIQNGRGEEPSHACVIPAAASDSPPRAVSGFMFDKPTIIQGGMGAGVSSWRLARAVSSVGQLGVVSGVALDSILARRLQDGDGDGSLRRALHRFPVRSMAERVQRKYFLPGGRKAEAPYLSAPMHSVEEARSLTELCIVGNFVEVSLAREGHGGPVGINYLEKIQMPHLPSIYGAMLAGVSFVLMGAGIATRIPGVLDRLAAHEPVMYELTVTGAESGPITAMHFDPRD